MARRTEPSYPHRYLTCVADYRRYLNRMREARGREADGEWPQGTRDLYNNPATAAYNKALAHALAAAWR
ncbi:hypothetical protein [Bifidobacterium saguinibicoloris]|uniref:hypothetical protein n=1 Tax=Bifidobacterium saguinibicoloris TaxID=2834433 RepID=UPI001C574024|nr:hypothetical protein [Bifidobacterium saguinibicoloris]MBW3080904.1 hypothetical protein [Bifidobacterium saguinibicoloris]